MNKLINRDLALLILIMGLATMAMAVLNPIMPLYLTSLNVVPDLIGLMLAVAMVGMVFGESSGGWLADRIGLKIPMSVGTFLCAPLVVCFVFTRGAPALFAVFIFWGIIRAGIFGPARGFIGNTATLTNKATIIAVYMTSLTLSRSLGSLVSGFVADNLGYHADFYFSSGLSLLAGALLILGLRNMPMRKPARVTAPEPAPAVDPLPRPAVNYRLVALQSVLAMLMFIGIGVNSFLPLLATEITGVAATQVGILYTLGTLVSAALFIPLGRLADRRNKKVIIVLGMLLTATGLAGLAFLREYRQLMMMVIISNIGFTMFTPAAVALLSNSLPSYWQGTAMGIYGAAEDIGIILGTGVGGFVWTAGGPKALYLMGSLAVVAGAIICLGFVRNVAARKNFVLR
jgi:MFS family permease